MNLTLQVAFVRGGVEDTRLEAKATKNPRPRPNLPRTDPLEAKDRNARGQDQGLRTPKKKVIRKKFWAISEKRSSEKIFRRSSEKTVFQENFQALHKLKK